MSLQYDWHYSPLASHTPLTPQNPINYSRRRTSEDNAEVPCTNNVGSIEIEESDNDNGSTIMNAVNNAGHQSASI